MNMGGIRDQMLKSSSATYTDVLMYTLQNLV
jgi:hypothetical protein